MSRLRGWKKVSETKRSITWRTTKGTKKKNAVVVQRDKVDLRVWFVFLLTSKTTRTLKAVEGKQKAIKFAVRFMRSRPRG